MRTLMAALGLTVALTLTGCGGGDDDASDDNRSGGGATADQPSEGNERDARTDAGDKSGFHACSLFTAEEIAAVLKDEVSDGRDYLATGPGATQCTWESADGATAVFIEVMLDGGRRWYDSVHLPGSAVGEVEEVDLGDKAVWDTFLGTVDLVDDDRFVSVQPVLFFSEVDSKAAAIELAEMTLKRLP